MNKKEFREFVYGLKPFIERLRLEGKEGELVKLFERYYPNLTVSYSYKNPVIAELSFRQHTFDGISWRIYELTDYDCTLTDDFANIDERSIAMCSDSKVKNIYIGFMKQNFSDYESKLSEQEGLHQSDVEPTL